MISLQNGIHTSFQELKEMGQSILNKVPEGTLFFGMHNPSSHLNLDMGRVASERRGIATPIVTHSTQMLGAIMDSIHKINPEVIWLDIRHSEAGVIGRRALERLTTDQKEIFKQQLYNISLGSAQKIPTEYALEAYNLYSDKDRITGRWAHEQDGLTYNVKILGCISPRSERTLWFADHAFMGPTYQKGLDEEFKIVRKTREFYNGNTR